MWSPLPTWEVFGRQTPTGSHQILLICLDNWLFIGSECQFGQVVIGVCFFYPQVHLMLSVLIQKLLYFCPDALLRGVLATEADAGGGAQGLTGSPAAAKNTS